MNGKKNGKSLAAFIRGEGLIPCRTGGPISAACLLIMAAVMLISCGTSRSARREIIPFPEGTIWKYTDQSGTRYQKFFAGGGLLVLGDIVGNDNQWYQENSTLYFSINSGYAEYMGEFVDSQTIRGSAHDLMGETWNFEMTRETDPALLARYTHQETWENGSIFPRFTWPLRGINEIRVRNPNAFSLWVAIRGDSGGAEDGGVDFHVPPSSFNSVFIPDGGYRIYFVFSYEPRVLYRGDGFYLADYGFEIDVVPDDNGNYGIHRAN
ncbi:MAG: hypothetical protein LBK62_11830 [Treponema sp.]|jgi:hypothetical protein|nr:hypothetical protein [Treponema sp.]